MPLSPRTVVPVTVAGVRVPASCLLRDGTRPPVLVLPGLGMSATEALGLDFHRVLPGRALLVPDFPGTGDTPGVPDVGVEDLARMGAELVRSQGWEPVVVVGHSMGGVAGLMLCLEEPERVAGFVNVEGNLGPGDCFVSRRVVTEPLQELVESLARSRGAGMARYAATLGTLRDHASLRSLSQSLVEHCALSPLLAWFTALRRPRLFLTGESSPEFPYLPDLRAAGIPVVTLTRCGHFPMYSRPVAYWRAVEEFVARVG